jgi:hypothetical protein
MRSGSTRADAGRTGSGFAKILTGPLHPDYEPFCLGPGHGTGYQDQIIIEAKDFLQAIATGKPVWPTSEDGMLVNQVIEASWKSHEERRWIDGLRLTIHNQGFGMTIRIGNAPCSWGVEFAATRAIRRGSACSMNAAAGYRHRAWPHRLHARRPCGSGRGAGRAEWPELIGGVVFRPFHDPGAWDEVKDAAIRTCKALVAHGARHLVLIDSISPRRAPTAGRPDEAEQMDKAEWTAFRGRIRDIARWAPRNTA